jgi:Skp family chaperone for outer membrane proteins
MKEKKNFFFFDEIPTKEDQKKTKRVSSFLFMQ